LGQDPSRSMEQQPVAGVGTGLPALRRWVVAGGGGRCEAWEEDRAQAVGGRGSGAGSAVAICIAGVQGVNANREHGRAGEGCG